ncbi:MAG: HAD family phosphatase [Clostridiales bacterium]|nr:HAD family phosphatase [Clostridiales bacterium]
MKLAIYDFDGTLFQNETLPFILKYWGKNNYNKGILIKTYCRILGLFLAYKVSQSMDREIFRAKASIIFIKLFENMTKEELIHFFSICSSSVQDHFNLQILQNMKQRKEEGYHIVLCSGAYDLLLEQMRQYVHIDTILGTKLHFTSDNTLDYKKPLHIVTGKNKSTALLEAFDKDQIDWENSYAFGDSYYDYDILSLTGNPIAVTPDEKLKKIALKKNWPII